jgi:hypothetical protein
MVAALLQVALDTYLGFLQSRSVYAGALGRSDSPFFRAWWEGS